jgi:hypothetical protein
MPNSIWLLALTLPLIGVAHAQQGEGNLVMNPGFEDAITGNAYTGWAFVDHGQDFARNEVEAVDYHGGLKAAQITISRQPKVYVSWYQHIRIKSDDEAPDRVSLWYRAPDAPADLVLGFIAIVDGQGVPRGGVTVPLEQSRDWRQVTRDLDVPAGTRDIQLELRASRQGQFRFDDVSLVRREKPGGGRPNRLLFVGIGREDLSYLWQDELAQAGWERVSFESWDNLTPELLKQCRVVFLMTFPLRPDVLDADIALTDMLVDYVNQGGGVMLTQSSGQVITGMTLHYYLAERFGTRLLFEKTISDPQQAHRFGDWGSDSFTYTDRVSPPLNEGVSGLPYQSYVQMGSLAGVLPFLPNDDWQVVLSGGPATRSEPTLLGLEEVDKGSRSEGFAADVPLAGVREMGQGRVAYTGQRPDIIFARAMKTDNDRKIYEGYMRGAFDGQPNGLVRFYLNAFQWLGAGADALQAAPLALRPTTAQSFTTAWKLHQGVIGPRTTYSTGLSTPEEYVAKARALQMDFIVFLEDMARLKPDGFESLKRDCRRLSTADFLAIPGVTYENSDGNHEYVIGHSVRLPSKLLLDDQRRLKVYPRGPDKESVCAEQTWLYQLLGFENCAGWYLFSQNPYPHFDTRDVNAMAVVTQEGGKTLERMVEAYGQEARNGQTLWPQALSLMKNASELDRAASGAEYRNVIGADGTKMLSAMFNTLAGRSARNLFPGMPCFGSTQVTNGPIIELTMPRGDTDAQGNIYQPALQEWPLDLKVTAPAGLAQIRLMDGDTPIRTFLPSGSSEPQGKTEFTFKTILPKERQKYVWVHAIDAKGHEAISRDIFCDSWLLRDQQCADRNNQLLYSMQRRADGSEYFVSYGADTCVPDKGPWNGRVRPVGIFVFDSKLGSGAMSYDGSPENHPQLSFNPYVIADGKLPDSMGWSRRLIGDLEGAPHVRPYRVVSSSEVLIGDRILDGVFPVNAKPVIHVWHTLYPVQPSTHLKTTARCTLYLPKVDGIAAYLWEHSFEALQDIPVKPEQPFTFGLGTIGGWPGQTDKSQRLMVVGGKVTEQVKLAGHPMAVTPFNRGDYVGILHSIFGSLAVYSLTDGLVLWGDGVNFQVGIKTPAGVVKRGTQAQASLLLVGINRLVAEPDKLAAQVAADYGLSGPPAYRVEARQGKVTGQDCRLTLDASKDHCFRGKLTGLAHLSGNLGSVITGLTDTWSAVFQVQDGSGKTRIIPVEQDTGYAVLRAEDEGKDVFIGHPLICDSPQVVISLARSTDWKTWQVEVHNPTAKALMVRVRPNPNVQDFRLTETIQLAPGSSVTRNAGPAPQQ